MNIKFDEMLRKIYNVLQKESLIYLFQYDTIKEFIFFYIHIASCYNLTQLLTAMLMSLKQISPLCLKALCHEKQVIWMYDMYNM